MMKNSRSSQPRSATAPCLHNCSALSNIKTLQIIIYLAMLSYVGIPRQTSQKIKINLFKARVQQIGSVILLLLLLLLSLLAELNKL